MMYRIASSILDHSSLLACPLDLTASGLMAGLNGASDVVISDFGNTYNDLLYVLYDVLV